jgi:hypothetical protein
LESIPEKDICIAVLGGSAAIASILLVFVGLMDTKADALPETTPDKTIRKYTLAARWGLFPLFSQVIVIFGAYLWMWWPSNYFMLSVWSVGFPIALIFFVVYSAVVALLL